MLYEMLHSFSRGLNPTKWHLNNTFYCNNLVQTVQMKDGSRPGLFVCI